MVIYNYTTGKWEQWTHDSTRSNGWPSEKYSNGEPPDILDVKTYTETKYNNYTMRDVSTKVKMPTPEYRPGDKIKYISEYDRETIGTVVSCEFLTWSNTIQYITNHGGHAGRTRKVIGYA